jgi:hypothetical protein
MQDYEKLGIFYLGHRLDQSLKGNPEDFVLYQSRDLLTHAVCIGMTGSGKTGLCLSVIEEAAMDGIPVVAIDPKGDISNLLLTFPNLSPEEFQPWVSADDAKRKGISVEELASQQAELWRNGLKDSFETADRIRSLKSKAEFLIYTPGSTAGLPISILKSFEAPKLSGDDLDERLAERVSQSASSLLALLGLNVDPLKSKEHILISNILDRAWRSGIKLDLAGLIQQIQKPPMDYVGALDLESFFPAKDRFELAMSLNNLIAAPTFQAWLKGEALDFNNLLYGKTGKPRVLIFSIAHLSDTERMFFVTLLLNQMLGWMREQSGTTSLRALLYMDEIFGYFPPVANPPSKQPLLTLLKQARAFGVGLVLATQNPVDLDYKGLSNTGTWFIGRLQTERDKMRVLDGLEGAAAESGSKFDRQSMEQILSSLGNRVFLLNNVHDNGPFLFKSRWTMSYLAGPLARDQIKRLMSATKSTDNGEPALSTPSLSPASVATEEPKSAPISKTETWARSAQQPALSPKIKQFFVPIAQTQFDLKTVVYRPHVFASMKVHFSESKVGLDLTETRTFVVVPKEQAVPVDWNDSFQMKIGPDFFSREATVGVPFSKLPGSAAQPENYSQWSKQAINWALTSQKTYLLRSRSLDVYSLTSETDRDFRIRLNHLMNERRDAQIDALRKKYAPKVEKLDEKIRAAEQKLAIDDQAFQEQQRDSAINAGATIFGAILRHRTPTAMINRATTAAKSFNKASKKKQELDNARDNLNAMQESKNALSQEMSSEIRALQLKFSAEADTFETVPFLMKKSGVTLSLSGLVWLPYSEKDDHTFVAAF